MLSSRLLPHAGARHLSSSSAAPAHMHVQLPAARRQHSSSAAPKRSRLQSRPPASALASLPPQHLDMLAAACAEFSTPQSQPERISAPRKARLSLSPAGRHTGNKNMPSRVPRTAMRSKSQTAELRQTGQSQTPGNKVPARVPAARVLSMSSSLQQSAPAARRSSTSALHKGSSGSPAASRGMSAPQTEAPPSAGHPETGIPDTFARHPEIGIPDIWGQHPETGIPDNFTGHPETGIPDTFAGHPERGIPDTFSRQALAGAAQPSAKQLEVSDSIADHPETASPYPVAGHPETGIPDTFAAQPETGILDAVQHLPALQPAQPAQSSAQGLDSDASLPAEEAAATESMPASRRTLLARVVSQVDLYPEHMSAQRIIAPCICCPVMGSDGHASAFLLLPLGPGKRFSKLCFALC